MEKKRRQTLGETMMPNVGLSLEDCIKYFNIQVYLLLSLFLHLLKDSFNDQELIIGIFNTKGCHWEMLAIPLKLHSLTLLSLQNLHLLRLH